MNPSSPLEVNDLSAITEALEGELFEAESEPLIPEESQKQIVATYQTLEEKIQGSVAARHVDLPRASLGPARWV